VTVTAEINDSQPLVAVAVTSSIPNPLPASAVELPWRTQRHPVTGLLKPCIANCAWLSKITTSEIERVGGTVPKKLLNEILALVAAHLANPPQNHQTP
jgi:hypothetical protein